MDSVTFISAIGSLSLWCNGLVKQVHFINHRYTASDPDEISALRQYANSHKFTIAEVGSIDLERLVSLHDKAEAAAIAEAEEKEQKRIAEAKKKQEEHDYFSTLRAADHAYM